MKICKIVDEYRDNALIGFLFHYEKSEAFAIELSPDLTVTNAPLFFEGFIKRGQFTVDQEISMRWVESRIVPRDRQNIGSVLRNNGLKEYDPYRLLVLAEGRCSQDECAVFPVRENQLPQWAVERLNKKIEFVSALEPWELLLIYRDGSIWRTDTEEMLREGERTRHLLSRPDRHREARLLPGGDGVEWSPGVFLTAAQLRDKGTKLPLCKDEFDSIIRSYVVDTSDICYELDCSRQYVSKLVKENGLEEFKATGSSRLFTKAEVDRLKD